MKSVQGKAQTEMFPVLTPVIKPSELQGKHSLSKGSLPLPEKPFSSFLTKKSKVLGQVIKFEVFLFEIFFFCNY